MKKELTDFHKTSEGVYYTKDQKTKVDLETLNELSDIASLTKLKRARVCTHINEKDKLHEMFVAVKKGSYIRPHKHLTKAESLSALEGRAIAVFFKDDGSIIDSFYVGNQFVEDRMYYRISKPIFHMLIILSETFIFHEATSGPFLREDTIFPVWSPDEKNQIACDNYIKSVRSQAESLIG